MAKVKIILHGKLLERCKETIIVYANTAREAITALKLRDEFNPEKTSERFVTTVEGISSLHKLDANLEVNELHLHCDQVKTKTFASGSGNNPYVNIIIGIILVVVGTVLLDASGTTQAYGIGLISAGVGMAIGGIMQIINPVDDIEDEDTESNTSVTSYPNTVASGTPIPLIVGKHKHGGHIFSLNTASRASKSYNLSGMITDLADFEDSWVTMHSQLSEAARDSTPSGGGGTPGGGGGGSWNNIRER